MAAADIEVTVDSKTIIKVTFLTNGVEVDMSRIPSFVVGDTVKITGNFYVSDSLTDPTTETFTIEEPDGTDNTPSVSDDSTGIKSVEFVPDQTGYHRWKIEGTGDAAGVKEGSFYVHTSGIS